MTFEEFLRDCRALGAQRVVLVPLLRQGGWVEFHAHPDGVDGETVDFMVRGDRLVWLDRAADGE